MINEFVAKNNTDLIVSKKYNINFLIALGKIRHAIKKITIDDKKASCQTLKINKNFLNGRGFASFPTKFRVCS